MSTLFCVLNTASEHRLATLADHLIQVEGKAAKFVPAGILKPGDVVYVCEESTGAKKRQL